MNDTIGTMLRTATAPVPLGVLPPAPRQVRGPRAALVNQVATAGGVEITLLSYVVVDHSLRVHGALRVRHQVGPVFASVPVLELTRVTGATPLRPLGAHVLPQPPIIWLAWMFEFPHAEPGVLSARIEELELAFPTGKRTQSVVGPWVFEGIPGPTIADGPPRQLATVVP